MTIIFFLVSLFVLCALVGSKIFEIKFDRAHFLANLFVKGDAKIHDLIKLAEFKYSRYKKIAHIFIFEFLPSFAYEILVRMKDYVSKKYYSAENRFSGKKILRGNGSVSFLLERLAEDKNGVRENKV